MPDSPPQSSLKPPNRVPTRATSIPTSTPPPGTSHRMATRSTERDLSTEEIRKETEALRLTPDKGREYLIKSQYLTEDTEITLPKLSFILLQLARTASLKHIMEGNRAIASLIEDESIHYTSTNIAESVVDKINPIMEDIASKLDNIAAKVIENTERQYDAGEDTRVALETATNNLQKAIKQSTAQQPRPTSEPFSAPHDDDLSTSAPAKSYAAAAAAAATATNRLPLSHASNVARIQSRERQVLIDMAPGASHNALIDLEEDTLVAKANEAINNTSYLAFTDETMMAVGARRLKNGGVIFEMDRTETAQFVRKHSDDFLKNFSAQAVVKDRGVTIMVMYVPIKHSSDPVHYRNIEKYSSIPANSIIHTRWIKPLDQRTDNQQTAHLRLKVDTIDTANNIIRHGLIISGKRVWAKRMENEPRRCLCCQTFTFKHIAATCDGTNACATCGEKDHKSNECTVKDKEKYKCINCDAHGHASWDRRCPKFISECKRLKDADEQSTYRFFPCNEPWTWEQKRGTPYTGNVNVSTQPQPQTSNRRQPNIPYQGRSWFEGTDHGRDENANGCRPASRFSTHSNGGGGGRGRGLQRDNGGENRNRPTNNSSHRRREPHPLPRRPQSPANAPSSSQPRPHQISHQQPPSQTPNLTQETLDKHLVQNTQSNGDDLYS